MAVRTTDAKVKGIIEVDPLISLTPFIEAASGLVDDLLDQDPPGFTTVKLERIERWLSAHFYAIRDQRVASEKADVVSQNFQYKVGLGFNQTIYGQQAMMIDTSGILAKLHKDTELGGKRSRSVVWLGTGDSDGNDISGIL